MKKLYIDKTAQTEPFSVFVKDREVVFAGATVSSMSVRHKNSEYQRFAEEYDIHFIFDDRIPKLVFYTIPQVDVFATDSKGGYLASLGRMVDLDSAAPIVYIDSKEQCFLVAENGKDFLKNVQTWKENLQPCEDVKFYTSKEAAQKENEFWERAMLYE